MRKVIQMVLVNKPPMGWNSWNTFGANIDEEMIFETADTMVREGLLECGYEYLVIAFAQCFLFCIKHKYQFFDSW